jgi:hypothetical protein
MERLRKLGPPVRPSDAGSKPLFDDGVILEFHAREWC